MTVRILTGDCRTLLAELEENSIDATVTDPPYELGFMGKKWDSSGVSFDPTTWSALLRVMKPGAYLLAFGGTRTYHRMVCAIEDVGFEIHDSLCWLYGSGYPKHESKLKPAWEPIVMARKPGDGPTLLNIEGCAIDFASPSDEAESKNKNRHADFGSGEVTGYHGWESRAAGGNYDPAARWPANVLLDEEAAHLIDKTDGGGPSRFFYCAKASRAEREHGLESFPAVAVGKSNAAKAALSRGEEYDNEDGGFNRTNRIRNPHPTVKPIALMKWLCRLVTPPHGLVLDPFSGSGSTGVAAIEEGFRFVGMEVGESNAAIATARCHAAQPSLFGP